MVKCILYIDIKSQVNCIATAYFNTYLDFILIILKVYVMPIVLFVENNIDNLNEQTAITFLIGCARKTVEFDQYCLNGSIEPICSIRLFFKRAFFQIIQFSINWCNKYFCFCKPVFL